LDSHRPHGRWANPRGGRHLCADTVELRRIVRQSPPRANQALTFGKEEVGTLGWALPAGWRVGALPVIRPAFPAKASSNIPDGRVAVRSQAGLRTCGHFRRLDVPAFLSTAASRDHPVPVLLAAFVPTHRCGAVPDSHRIPSCLVQATWPPPTRTRECRSMGIAPRPGSSPIAHIGASRARPGPSIKPQSHYYSKFIIHNS
jgi:hypothetical protein